MLLPILIIIITITIIIIMDGWSSTFCDWLQRTCSRDDTWLPARIFYLGEYRGHSRYRVSQKGKNLHSLCADVPPLIFFGRGGTSVCRLKFAVWQFSLVGVCPLDDTPLDVICHVIILEFPDVFWKYCVMWVCHCAIFLCVLFENIGTNPPRFIFYHLRSTDFEEKIEGLWTWTGDC